MSEAITRGVRIKVDSEYLSQDSNPDEDQYLFAYHITIFNEGDEAVQLLSRHWVITNAEGHEENVRGPGVVGQQPIIDPGESYSYSSYCPLKTPVGTMHGSYQMITASDENFDAEIAPFRLMSLRVLH